MESMVPVCDKRYHIYNRFRHFGAEIKKMWNYPLHVGCKARLKPWLHYHVPVSFYVLEVYIDEKSQCFAMSVMHMKEHDISVTFDYTMYCQILQAYIMIYGTFNASIPVYYQIPWHSHSVSIIKQYFLT